MILATQATKGSHHLEERVASQGKSGGSIFDVQCPVLEI